MSFLLTILQGIPGGFRIENRLLIRPTFPTSRSCSTLYLIYLPSCSVPFDTLHTPHKANTLNPPNVLDYLISSLHMCHFLFVILFLSLPILVPSCLSKYCLKVMGSLVLYLFICLSHGAFYFCIASTWYSVWHI